MTTSRKKINRYNEVIPVLVWTFVFVLPFVSRIVLFPNDPRNGSLTAIFFSFLTIIALFYLHTYIVYPLLKRRRGRWLYTGGLVFLFALFLLSMSFFMRDVTATGLGHGIPSGGRRSAASRIVLIFPFALIIFCSISYRMYIENIRQNEKIKEMETTHLKTELDFLRSQISPHFLFNLMNTLVSMARVRSELMEPSLISLSQLMRYMLYESDNEKISLQSELDYLKNYINLQLLRFGDTVRFNLFESGDLNGYTIEPMLLIPFVENAFKHGIEYVDSPMIEVDISIAHHPGLLRLKVMNSVGSERRHPTADSGIGLANVQRRLALLYPQRHVLLVEEKDGLYIVYLEINL